MESRIGINPSLVFLIKVHDLILDLNFGTDVFKLFEMYSIFRKLLILLFISGVLELYTFTNEYTNLSFFLTSTSR